MPASSLISQPTVQVTTSVDMATQAPPAQTYNEGYQTQAQGMTTTPPKSEIQEDLEAWVQKVGNASRNTHAITNASGEAPWYAGFWECFNPVDECLVTCCCPCITFGKTHHRLNKDADLKGYSPINGSVSRDLQCSDKKIKKLRMT